MVAEKDVVYERFPIPLINRLEKHLLVMTSGLTKIQADLVRELEEWVNLFSEVKSEYSSEKTYEELFDEICDAACIVSVSFDLDVVLCSNVYRWKALLATRH